VDDEIEPASPAPLDAGERTFNVILVTVDTLRFDLGFAGYPRPVSPNLDRLAAKATVYERAYALASYTAKSIGPMLIGQYPSETNRDYEHYTTFFPSNTFVAERLQAGGVRTIAGHCHYYFKWKTGYSQGFDVFDTSAIAPEMADNDTSVTSDRLTDLAIDLLSRPENVTPGVDGQAGSPRRFFAWFHYFDPHAQYVAHPEAPDFAAMSTRGVPAGRAAYDGEIWFTDHHLGRLLDYVESQPWGADTAVIVTADHGESFGEHGFSRHGRELWEATVRVPLVLYVPGAEPRRIAVKRSHIDLVPTILELTGTSLPPTGQLRGESLLADVRAKPGEPLEERDVLIDMPEGPYNELRRAIVTGPSPGTKLLHFGGSRYELYDLATDPWEKNDLATDPERVAKVIRRLDRARSRLREIAAIGAPELRD
jgi:choline-sulfatase